MIRRSARTSDKQRFPVLFIFIVPIILAIFLYHFVGTYYLPVDRTTVLFLNDPVEVISFGGTQKQWSRVQFPANTHVAGIHGLGSYAVDSLWNIAAIEASPSAVVLGSITDELGVPVEYYVGERGNIWIPQDQNSNSASSYFGFMGIIKRLMNKLDTNIPIPLYIALTRSFRSTENHRIQIIKLEQGNGLIEKKLPDESTILEFERDQFDARTADIFVERTIRDERLRISVFNTTGIPFLGSRVARIIDRLGSNVIQVGNENTPINECEISGLPQKLETKTAASISKLFDCVSLPTTEQGRADLIVRTGTAYQRRFLPKERP